MGNYLKKFENHTQYENYINGSEVMLPNVSICTTKGDVHYNSWVETRVVATFNVTDISNPTPIGYDGYTSCFSAIEIDGVEQPSVVSAYTFSTTGEHIVKYTLTDPTSISNNAFYGCSGLTSIDIPNSVTSIGDSILNSCSGLTSINIPDSVRTIGMYAFRSCTSLTSIDIPDSVTSIGSNAFYNCTSLTSANINSGRIGGSAFGNCSGLTSCTIGGGVTSIGDSAFKGCTSLTSIYISNSVTTISNFAFNTCTSLTSIVCNATTAPTIEMHTFRDIKTGGILTVPIGSSGYDVWMGTGNYYLGKYGWTKVEQ